jgi:hypothetical protein
MHHGLAKRGTGRTALLAAALLVFTQIAVAAEACAAASAAAQADAGCTMTMERELCLARCIAEVQATPTVDHPTELVVDSGPVRAARPQLSQPQAFALFGKPFVVPRSPPLRIVFCSYRT